MMYNETVRECFFAPRHVGEVDLNTRFSVQAKTSQKGQGDIRFYLHCNADGIIARACFKTNGNPYVIAGLEWLCRRIEGQSIDQVPEIEYPLLIKELDIPAVQYPVALGVATSYKEAVQLMKNQIKR